MDRSESSRPIRIIFADDSPAVRRAVAAALLVAPDLTLVGEAADGREALLLCEQTQPDVALIDLLMPRLSGPDVARAIRRRWPHIHVIGLTAFEETGLFHDMIHAGATICLLKDITAAALANAIRAAVVDRPPPA